MRSFRKLFLLAWGWSAALGAEAPLNPAAPLARDAPAVSAGSNAVTRTSAQQAQELGISSLAATMYRELLDRPGADRSGLTLALATTLLEAGNPEEAEKVLGDQPPPHEAAWHLRAGLAAMQLKKRAVAQSEWDATREDLLPPTDRPWFWWLAGALYDTVAARDGATEAKANEYYIRAEANAPNELARSRFQMGAEEVRLLNGLVPTLEQVRALRVNYEAHRGTAVGYESAKYYVIDLVAREQKNEALIFLTTELLPRIPVQEKYWWDYFRLATGLIGDRGRSIAGRKALTQLLEGGSDPRRQRQALQLLFDAAKTEPARGELRTALDKFIGVKPNHPILESLLYYRAQLALAEGKSDEVIAHATRLLDEFPRSPLRVQTYGLLTQLWWGQQRFRLAADNARKVRAEMAAATEPALVAARAELAVVEAEAWFRAGDYPNAADAYATALRERPANVKPSDLMFQRVLAEIRAGSSDAAKVLDDLEGDQTFDLESRWQAEWSLARSLETRGPEGAKQAYARVTKLLGEPVAGIAQLGPELPAKLAWLQTRLSFDAGDFQQTLKLAGEKVPGLLSNVELELKKEIASRVLLLQVQAEFELRRDEAAFATLKKLREDYPNAEAAIESFLIESAHYADQEKIDIAKQQLIKLTETRAYAESPLVPYAYYQLALLSERLGQEKDLKEANGWIEQLIANPVAVRQGDLIFAARMKQGEILTTLNNFAPAQQVYDELIQRPPSTENLILAQLALARTHNAQAAGDSDSAKVHANKAKLLFAELCDRVDASPDVRVEAGYNLGALLAARGNADDAVKVWWGDVITRFLPEDQRSFEMGAKRPYFLARTLLELAGLYEQQQKLPEAKNAYQLILDKNLSPGRGMAEKALERLGVPPPKP